MTTCGGGFGWPPARLPPWTGRRPWAGPRGRTGRWRLMRRLAASTVPLAQPVAHQDDRYHQERQGKQERLIRCEVAEPLDKCHDSLHEAGQAAGEPRPRDTAKTLRRRAQRLRQSWRPAHKDLVHAISPRSPVATRERPPSPNWISSTMSAKVKFRGRAAVRREGCQGLLSAAAVIR